MAEDAKPAAEDLGELRKRMVVLDAELVKLPEDRAMIYTHYPQLPDLMNGVLRVVFGLSDIVQFRFVALAFSFASLFFIYQLLCAYWSRQTAQVAIALWVINPLWIQHADYLHHLPYAAFFGFGSMYFLVRYLRDAKRGWLAASGAFLFLTILSSYDYWFFAPLLIALIAFTVMATWQKGREIVIAKRQSSEGSLTDFIEHLRRKAGSIANVPGTAIFLNRGNQTAPLAMRANVDHNHVRHEHVLIISVETLPVPRLRDDDRIEVDPLGYEDDGIFYVSLRFGYAEAQDLQAALNQIDPDTTEGRLDLENASWFLSKIELRRGTEPTMAAWRKRLFIATSHITADAAEHFGLPRDRTVIMGSHIEV